MYKVYEIVYDQNDIFVSEHSFDVEIKETCS